MADKDALWTLSCASREVVEAEEDVERLTVALRRAQARVDRALASVVACSEKLKKGN